jgi:hypothetical protein
VTSLRNAGVTGSSPVSGTTFLEALPQGTAPISGGRAVGVGWSLGPICGALGRVGSPHRANLIQVSLTSASWLRSLHTSFRRSALFMLVSALMELERIRDVYAHALANP